MNKTFLQYGAFLGALSVILGAFAAHALKSRVTPDVAAIFETGVRYQFYHSFALIFTGILFKEFAFSGMVWAGRMFIIGIILFSGSLYLLTYFKAIGNTSLLFVGAITPLGGLAFISGWILLFTCFSKKKI